MLNPTFSGGGSGPSPALQRYRRRYLATQTFATSGTWRKSDALALPHLAGLASPDIDCDVECVGGGASGSHGVVRGGAPGGVRRVTRAFADMPDIAAVTVGAGGPVPPTALYSGYALAGGESSFGDICAAPGGLGIASGNWSALATSDLRPPSDLALSDPSVGGEGQGYNVADSTAPSFGPGAGGAGVVNPDSSGTRNGTRGGDSGCGAPSTRLSGGALGAPGADASTEWQYGSGGGGAGRNTAAGRGGRPGGGGGGGRTIGGGGNSSWDGAGPGGGGTVRVRFYVWEAV